MSLINSKLCKFEMNYAIFFSIISGNTIITLSSLAIFLTYYSMGMGTRQKQKSRTLSDPVALHKDNL